MILLLLGTACSGPAPGGVPPTAPPPSVPPPPATASEPPRRFGELMDEVGRRFERAGRAARARSWELAAYDLHEIEEVFEDDLPTARVPHEITADVRSIGAAFAAGPLEELRDAARAEDEARFAAAFAAAADACNVCHEAAEHAFILVPDVPGAAVPVIDDAPTAPRASE